MSAHPAIMCIRGSKASFLFVRLILKKKLGVLHEHQSSIKNSKKSKKESLIAERKAIWLQRDSDSVSEPTF